MDCRCAEKVEKELADEHGKIASIVYGNNLTKEVYIAFDVFENKRYSDMKELEANKKTILVSGSFCPFCGKKYRFANEDDIKKYKGEG